MRNPLLLSLSRLLIPNSEGEDGEDASFLRKREPEDVVVRNKISLLRNSLIYKAKCLHTPTCNVSSIFRHSFVSILSFIKVAPTILLGQSGPRPQKDTSTEQSTRSPPQLLSSCQPRARQGRPGNAAAAAAAARFPFCFPPQNSNLNSWAIAGRRGAEFAQAPTNGETLLLLLSHRSVKKKSERRCLLTWIRARRRDFFEAEKEQEQKCDFLPFHIPTYYRRLLGLLKK